MKIENSYQSSRSFRLKAAILEFVDKRRQDKLDSTSSKPEDVDEINAKFAPEVWLADAARRTAQLQAVTHSLKPVHPSARGTNIFLDTHALKDEPLVSSHVLGKNGPGDVTGNASALDVYKFLKLEFDGGTLLDLALESDADFIAALSEDRAAALGWVKQFCSLTEPRGKLASHTLAKQLLWRTGEDPTNDAHFTVIAPLYPTSLVHRVFHTIQDDRFSEEAKAAREARKVGVFSDRPVREYPNLAAQKLGGTKPQNISQLNSERGGTNYLLASCPPIWRRSDVTPLIGVESMFVRFGRLPEVRRVTREMVTFFKNDPSANLETRQRREAWLDELIDLFLNYSARFDALPEGWSQVSQCLLPVAEQHWLDREGCEKARSAEGLALPVDTLADVAASFANWLNVELKALNTVADPEFREWRKQFKDTIRAKIREGEYEL